MTANEETKRYNELQKKYQKLRSAVAFSTRKPDIVPTTNEGLLCVVDKKFLEKYLEE